MQALQDVVACSSGGAVEEDQKDSADHNDEADDCKAPVRPPVDGFLSHCLDCSATTFVAMTDLVLEQLADLVGNRGLAPSGGEFVEKSIIMATIGVGA